MSILIEQDRDQVNASASFHRRVDLDSLCLVNARIDRQLDWSSLKNPIEVNFEFTPRDAKIEGCRAEIRTHFRFRSILQSRTPPAGPAGRVYFSGDLRHRSRVPARSRNADAPSKSACNASYFLERTVAPAA